MYLIPKKTHVNNWLYGKPNIVSNLPILMLPLSLELISNSDNMGLTDSHLWKNMNGCF